MTLDLNSLEGIQAALAGLNQTAVVAAEPEVVVQPKIELPTQIDGPLTESEAIQLIQKWTAEDQEVELSEQRTVEEMVTSLHEAAEDRGSDVPGSRLQQIVKQHAPNAPRKIDVPEPAQIKTSLPYPAELAKLVQTGVAFVQSDHWFAHRCTNCGQFKTKCCGLIEPVSAVRDDYKTFTSYGRQAVGLDPIKPPTPKLAKTQDQIVVEWKKQPWWIDFRGVGELQGNGSVKMYIENFLAEGITLITGPPKDGKSWLALAVAKALTSGKPLFGRPGFEVPEIIPVLYLAAESGDGGLKLRCEKFGITEDKTKFITRTLTQGPMFGLADNKIESLVKTMRPIVILETLIRFNEGEDEDSSSDNKKLADQLFQLLGWGARAVIGIHHSRKDLKKSNPTKQSAVRGSSDGLAMVDAVWLVMQDEKQYHKSGTIEIDVMGWGRDFTPTPMRLALTKKAPPNTSPDKLFSPGVVSCIDQSGNLEWVEKKIVFGQVQDEDIEQLMTDNPSITIEQIADRTHTSAWDIRKAIKRLGYTRPPGGKKNGTEWMKAQPE